MSTDSNPEAPDDQDIVPELKKYQVNLSLTDLFTTLHERPRLVVEAAAAQQASQPGLLAGLNRTSCSTCSASANWPPSCAKSSIRSIRSTQKP